MEPYYPPAWGNLAVLYRMLGERELAVSAVRRAAELSARSSVYWYALGWMAEDVQQDDVAREAYQRAVLIMPDLPLRSDWNDSVLRRSVRLPANKVSALARTMAQLLRGRTHNAWMTWRDAPSTERLTAAGYLADAWFALDRHDRHTAQMFIEWARLSEGTSTVYSRLGQSWLLRYDGNIEQADAELGILRRDIAKNLDNSWILSLSYVQYKVTTLPFIYLKELDASPVPITVQRMLDLKPER
jgi:tetratricopeptide (TPR) repeat protein